MVHLRARTAGRMRIRQRQLLIILTTLKKAQTNFHPVFAEGQPLKIGTSANYAISFGFSSKCV